MVLGSGCGKAGGRRGHWESYLGCRGARSRSDHAPRRTEFAPPIAVPDATIKQQRRVSRFLKDQEMWQMFEDAGIGRYLNSYEHLPRLFAGWKKGRYATRGVEGGEIPGRLGASSLPCSDPHRGFFGRLVAAGKPKGQAVGACLRTLVMPCCGVLKHLGPFDPAW